MNEFVDRQGWFFYQPTSPKVKPYETIRIYTRLIVYEKEIIIYYEKRRGLFAC